MKVLVVILILIGIALGDEAKEPLRAKNKRSGYSGAPVVSAPTRVSFPNFGNEPVAGSSAYVGFQINPGVTLTQTKILSDSFFGWDTTTNKISIDVSNGCTFKDHGSVNSFCDIPIPNPYTFSGSSVSPISPVVNKGYTLSCPAPDGTFTFLNFWVSSESFIEGGMLVMTYQYFYGTPGAFQRSSTYNAPPCGPTVTKVSPSFAYNQGSVIFLEGTNFGIDEDQISVKIGTSIVCNSVEMVVADTVIRCIASSASGGTNLPIVITVKSNNSTAPYQLISFSSTCPLVCTQNSYPDPSCTTCITPQGSTDDAGTSRLSQVVSSISSDLVEATYFSDVSFMVTANLYKNNAVMEVLSIPRYTVPDVTVDMKFAIAATTPLKITALTNLLQGFDVDVIPSLELHYESQQAQWTKVDNNGTSTYRLDLV